ARQTAARIHALSVRPAAHPQSGALTSPSDSTPTPAASSPAPNRSGSRVIDASRDSGTHLSVASSATTPTGTLTRNTHRQLASTSNPPITGPSAAATAPAAAQIRTERARCSGADEAITRPRLAGVRIAAPTA